MKKIVTYPDPILRVRTGEITSVDEKLLKEVEELKEVLTAETSHAAGLAAVQIGIDRRFFGLLIGNDKVMKIFLNPRIERTVGEKTRPVLRFEDGKSENFLEGCLSFPELFGTVKRFLEVEGSWDEIEDGKLIRMNGRFKGIDAIAFQHESEHLDGILFVDHIKEEGGELYKWMGDKKVKWSVEKVLEME